MTEQLLMTAPVGVMVTDISDSAMVSMVNQAAGAIFGMMPDALIGQPVTVLGTEGSLEELLVQALVTEKNISGEILLGDAGLPQRHIHTSITRAIYDGKPSLLWWLSDVTDIRRTEEEWKRRERQLHAVIDAAQDAVFEFQLNTGGATVSPRFWQFLGFSLAESVTMQNSSSESIYHYVREDMQLSFAASLGIPDADRDYEWTGAFKDIHGQEIWLYMRGRITDVATEPRIIGVATDISAQKAVEENLRNAKDSAEEANRAKSAFLATMSHEIRTPMTAILGSLEYILDTPLAKEQHRMVSIARDSGISLLAILNDILDLSKIEAGKLTLEDVTTSPRNLVQGACDAAQIVARQKGLYLRCKFAEPPPQLIVADPTRLRQILVNLVNNAVKFTEQGGITVTAEITDEGQGEGIFRVTVQDTGIGLTDAQRERLFKPFTQADDTTTRKFGGTGLGLSICQRLVERMGGQIGVYSKPGHGATFWFWVRIKTTDQEMDEAQRIDLKHLPILLVDPDPETSEKTTRELTEVGGAVTAVGDGREALLQLAQNGYSVVLLEQNLPEAKGLELVPALRTLSPELNVILYTAEEQDTISWAAQEAGIHYLPRSTPYQQFMETIKSFAAGAPILDYKRSGRLTGRVLIAEDTAAVRQILEVQVRGIGVEVDFVENGKQAIEKLQRGRYALVISDLHMPEMDGYGLVHEWRDREARRGKGDHLPIVALTADVLIGDHSKFLAEGFDDYMAKPVSRDALRNLIAKWLGRAVDEKEQKAEAAAGGAAVADDPPPVSVTEHIVASADSGHLAPSSDPASPVVHDRLIEILGMDDADILSEAMSVFVSTAIETFSSLTAAYSEGSSDKAKGPAHSLKGSARMAGAVTLGDIAAELDAAAKAGQLLPDRLEACRVELERVLDFVQKVYIQESTGASGSF